jgi:hypothetical protein
MFWPENFFLSPVSFILSSAVMSVPTVGCGVPTLGMTPWQMEAKSRHVHEHSWRVAS